MTAPMTPRQQAAAKPMSEAGALILRCDVLASKAEPGSIAHTWANEWREAIETAPAFAPLYANWIAAQEARLSNEGNG